MPGSDILPTALTDCLNPDFPDDDDECPSLEFTAVAGPTHDRHPPFRWSANSLDLGDVPNFRTIDEFDFLPVRATWNLAGGAQ